MSKIYYREGYKYQLHVSYEVQTGITGQAAIIPDPNSTIPWVQLFQDGLLRIKAGYAWDGPSGPAIDTRDFMRGSLVHDALYQLMRASKLDQETRPVADELMYRLCIEDGMNHTYATICMEAVKEFAAYAAAPQREKVLTAP
jgi:hypothetical protein